MSRRDESVVTYKGESIVVDAQKQPREWRSGIADLIKRIVSSAVARELVEFFDEHIRPWLGF